MKYYINYADDNFKQEQKIALKTAAEYGEFDEIIGYAKSDIDADFYQQNKAILAQKRGSGYWLWKPYFICKTLEKMAAGDYLFYSDSGAFFIDSVDKLITQLEEIGQDIVAYQQPYLESDWTKQELFINMDCNTDEYKNSLHIQAGFQLIKKTDFSVKFYQQLLKFSANEINITDKFDTNIKQADNFIRHRHDQSVFSLQYKKHKLKALICPSKLEVVILGRKTTISKYISFKAGYKTKSLHWLSKFCNNEKLEAKHIKRHIRDNITSIQFSWDADFKFLVYYFRYKIKAFFKKSNQ